MREVEFYVPYDLSDRSAAEKPQTVAEIQRLQ